MPGNADIFKSSDSVVCSPSSQAYLDRLEKSREKSKEKAPSLHSLASKGDHITLQQQLEDGADVNKRSDDGSTALTLAAYHGHGRCVKLLLKNGADGDSKNDKGDQPLHLAVKRNNKKCVSYLLDHGVDVNSRGSTGLCPIHTAAKYGYDAILSMLLEHGARTDRYSNTENPQHALHFAAGRGQLACIRILLEHNAYTEPRDGYGRTPLFTAVVKNQRDTVLVLASKTKTGSSYNKKVGVLIMIGAGADVNAADKNGKLPLQVAIEAGNDAICHTLCEHGADVSLRYVMPKKEEVSQYTIDRYGLITNEKPHGAADLLGDITKIGDEARSLQSELARVSQWERMIKHWPRYTHHKWEKVRKRIGRGIPDCVRGRVWKLLCKLNHQIDPAEFKELRNRDSVWAHQIDLDVERALRNHLMYRTRYGKGQCALFGVLKAYSNYDPTLGYCQGMGDMAALLLKYIPERESYCVFDILMREPKYALRGSFFGGFPKLQQTFFVHEKLLEIIHPKLFYHFQTQGAVAPLYCTKWYLTVFLDIFSFEATLRIWDLFFMEGYDILYSVAIAILIKYADDLMNMKFDKLMVLLHTLNNRNIDVNEFIDYVMDHRISSRTISRYEKMYTQQDTTGVLTRTLSDGGSRRNSVYR